MSSTVYTVLVYQTENTLVYAIVQCTLETSLCTGLAKVIFREESIVHLDVQYMALLEAGLPTWADFYICFYFWACLTSAGQKSS